MSNHKQAETDLLREIENGISAAFAEMFSSKPIKIPGPDHPITITPTKGQITVVVAGKRVADTREALTLKEAAYPAVQYIPRKDIDQTQLQRTSHQTYCPYKGECAYYSIPAGRGTLGQRRLELRGPLCRRIGNPGIPRVLPGPGHSAHIPPGREGLFNLVRRVPTTLRYEAGVILADEDFVSVRGRFSDNRRPRNWIAADVVRIADGLLVEHLEVLQDEATRDESQSGRPVFGGEFPCTGETSGRALYIR
jgi:uncharacterized protein (DUF427 family)